MLQTILIWYVAIIFFITIIFSVKNNNRNPIGGRFVFWLFFPVGVGIMALCKLGRWKVFKFKDTLVNALIDLFDY